MRIYQIAKCPFAHRARIVLEEKQLAYTIVYFESKQRPAELAALGAEARSPTIFDEAHQSWVWDSLIVAEYLDERYPDRPLMPEDPSARARARLAMHQADAQVGTAGGPLIEDYVHKPPEARDPSKVEQVLPRLHHALEPWQARLANQPFLMGEAFTLADLALYTPLFAVAGLVGWERAIPGQLGQLRAWRERVSARPSTTY